MGKTLKKTNQKQKGKIVSLVRKSNNLIEAKYNFDIWEMRLFLILISQIRRDDQDFGTYRIYYRDVAKTFGLNLKRGYAEIRESAKSLLDKKFYVDTVEDGFHRQNIYHIIRNINILKEGQEGRAGVENQEYIDVRIEDEMKPLLLQLQRSFTTYDFDNIINLGLYAIRIYELLKQYESIGHRTLKFEEMKKMFELEDKYPLFANFMAKVINPSVKEINKNTDLLVTKMEQVKEGKKTIALRFDFRVQKKLKQEVDTTPQAEQIVMDFSDKLEQTEIINIQPISDERFSKFYPKVVETLGVTPSVFIEMIKTHSDEQFEQAIRVTHRAKIEGQIKTNISGFFVQALKKGYTDQKEERMKKDKKEDAQKKLALQISECEMEKKQQILARIRELTNENSDITFDAIDALKLTEEGQKNIESTTILLGRPLEVEDFRQNESLRKLLIDMIFNENIDKFADILREYERKITALKEKAIF